MSSDPSPVAVPAAVGAPRSAAAPPRRWSAETLVGEVAPTVVADRTGGALDEAAWCRWWRDLIVERYRFDRFDALVPLPASDCPWEQRVALGRVVEQSMAAVPGPAMTTQLVIEAIAVAGFGPVRDLAPDARRVALVRSGWCSEPWAGDDDLRLAVLGSVADALLREVPPTPAALDLRDRATDAGGLVAPTILGATRQAVFAYARQVEALACRSREAARSYQF